MTRDELGAVIEERILSGELPAGAKLPSERQLAETYAVSRPIVREVLRSLAERNLIEVFPARGSYVRDVRPTDPAGMLDLHYRRSQATPRDLVEARMMLECTAAALAAARASAEDLSCMADALHSFQLEKGVYERAQIDLAFHATIARAAHNPVIESMFGSIANLALDLMLRSLSDAEVTRASTPYHVQVYDAIAQGDSEAARAAMAAHLAVASQLYGEDYEQSIESVLRRQAARLDESGVFGEDVLALSGASDARGRTDVAQF
jgi:GntR family transcriptional repressor for pyruvate dehydrogenase complex